MNSAFYIDDLERLREKLARASLDATRLGRVWDSVVRRARNAPGDFPWFTPLAAQDEEWCTACEARKAVAAIRNGSRA